MRANKIKKILLALILLSGPVIAAPNPNLLPVRIVIIDRDPPPRPKVIFFRLWWWSVVFHAY